MPEASGGDGSLRHPIRYRLEAAGLWLVFAVFRALPLDAASALGGGMLRCLGPLLPWHRRALANLGRVLPELEPAETRRIAAGMWDNLGRTLAELAHLAEFRPSGDASDRIEVVGAEHAARELQRGCAVLAFSGHIGNWELLPLAAPDSGQRLAVVHRRANNPLVERLLSRARGASEAERVSKGRQGARRLLALIKANASIGLLVDQKLNEGLAVPFFGLPAMTTTAPAQFALHYRLPLLPMRCERLGGARFRISFGPPLTPPETGDPQRDVAVMTAEINRTLEGWIRERPEQWLWMHRRWPDESKGPPQKSSP